MNDIFRKTGLALILLGVGFYFLSETGSITILIPAFLGAIVYALVLLSEKFPNQHKHFAHVNLFVLAAGCGATYKSVFAICDYLFKGEALARPLASIEQFTTFMLCLAAIIAGIKSFVDARKK
tara:strand:+ start:99 stop:467 length:369 start_codon:yes stop_codon:yes gene_type:complete